MESIGQQNMSGANYGCLPRARASSAALSCVAASGFRVYGLGFGVEANKPKP